MIPNQFVLQGMPFRDYKAMNLFWTPAAVMNTWYVYYPGGEYLLFRASQKDSKLKYCLVKSRPYLICQIMMDSKLKKITKLSILLIYGPKCIQREKFNFKFNLSLFIYLWLKIVDLIIKLVEIKWTKSCLLKFSLAVFF